MPAQREECVKKRGVCCVIGTPVLFLYQIVEHGFKKREFHMTYRSSEKTRAKKDAKRTAMMQAAVQVFAEKGYHAATVRDIVSTADVAIGTFYFYFPDKETLFLFLYEETADFLLQTIEQAVSSRNELPRQMMAGSQAYANLATYEPTVVQLLLVGGIGAVPSLADKRIEFRRKLMRMWKRVLDNAVNAGELPPQPTQHTAEFLTGGFDEMVLNLLEKPNPEAFTQDVIENMTELALRATGYHVVAHDDAPDFDDDPPA
jgi:AcrR family transcriptional regulator